MAARNARSRRIGRRGLAPLEHQAHESGDGHHQRRNGRYEDGELCGGHQGSAAISACTVASTAVQKAFALALV